MNFEVFCFGWVQGRRCIVQKEYFDTYEEALAFERSEEAREYDCVDITPMNEAAYNEMR